MRLALLILLSASVACAQEIGPAPPLPLGHPALEQVVYAAPVVVVPPSYTPFRVVPKLQRYVPPVVYQQPTVRPITIRTPNTAASAANWHMGSIPMTRANLIAHLMGEIGDRGHGGLFSRSQLNSLTTSQLMSVHSNAHRGVPYTTTQRTAPQRAVQAPRSVRTLTFGNPARFTAAKRAQLCPT